MIEQTTGKRFRTPPKLLSQEALAIIRMVYDSIVLILAFASIFSTNSNPGNIMGIDAMVFYAIVCALILVGSVSSFFLIRREKTTLGTNILIYSLALFVYPGLVDRPEASRAMGPIDGCAPARGDSAIDWSEGKE